MCLFPLFILIPGYAVAWLLDLFEFRRRTWLFRAALSVPLSIAIAPILSYLAGRYLSMTAVWGLYAASWVYVAVVGLRGIALRGRNQPAPRSPAGAWRMAVVVLSIWGALALFSLVDLQIGGKLYYSTTAFDFSVRTQFIHAISTTGIPPANPFFFPGHAQPLRYHYFWMILCSMVDVRRRVRIARHADRRRDLVRRRIPGADCFVFPAGRLSRARDVPAAHADWHPAVGRHRPRYSAIRSPMDGVIEGIGGDYPSSGGIVESANRKWMASPSTALWKRIISRH